MKFQTSLAVLATAAFAFEERSWAPEAAPKVVEQCPSYTNEYLDTPEYQAMSAYCKQKLIWGRIKENDTVNRFFVGADYQKMFNEDCNLQYDTVSDTMPYNIMRRTYARGVHTLAEFIPTDDTPYTGIFKGSRNAVVRISEFTQTTPELPKTSPGGQIKFLRDGMASANLHAAFAIDGQPSFNYFKNRWTNVLRHSQNECTRETYQKWQADGSDFVGCYSLMEMALYDDYGNHEEAPHWPYMIELEPYDVYGWTDAYQNDFNDQLKVIKPNVALFKVLAYDEPPELDGKERLIGWISTRSETVTSLWGDKNLFFQSHRYEDDIQYRPHYGKWLQRWDNGKYSTSALKSPAPLQKCPFFFLFEEAGLA